MARLRHSPVPGARSGCYVLEIGARQSGVLLDHQFDVAGGSNAPDRSDPIAFGLGLDHQKEVESDGAESSLSRDRIFRGTLLRDRPEPLRISISAQEIDVDVAGVMAADSDRGLGGRVDPSDQRAGDQQEWDGNEPQVHRPNLRPPERHGWRYTFSSRGERGTLRSVTLTKMWCLGELPPDRAAWVTVALCSLAGALVPPLVAQTTAGSGSHDSTFLLSTDD